MKCRLSQVTLPIYVLECLVVGNTFWSCPYSQRTNISIIISVMEVKLATVVEGNPQAPFSKAITLKYRGGHYPCSAEC